MARKLNTKFLTLLIASLVLIVIAMGTAYFFLKPTAAKLEAKGDAEFAAGDFQAAALDLGKAASKAPNDIRLQIKYVDALDYTVQGSQQRYAALRGTLSQILANDPRSVPALQRVIYHELNDVRSNPADTASVRLLSANAARLLQLEPDNVEAKRAMITAVIEPASIGLESSADELAKQQQAAQDLYDANNNDTDALQMLARFYQINIARAAQQGDSKAALDELTKLQSLVDTAIQKTPDNAGAWYSHFSAYQILVRSRPELAKDIEKMAKLLNNSLEKANALTKPSDGDQFLDIRLVYLRTAELTDLKKAEEIHKKLIEELPDSRYPRISMADFLSRLPTRRDDAAKVLETPWKPTQPLKSIESLQQNNCLLIERVKLCTIKLSAIDAVTDAQDRDRRQKEVQQLYDALQKDPDITQSFKPALMRIAGGIQVLNGQLAAAISTFDDAQKLLREDSRSSLEQQFRNDLLLQYATVQLRLGQTGKARPALEDLLTRDPSNLNARAALLDVLISERSYEQASTQLNVMQQMLGSGNPLLRQFELRLLAQRSDQLVDKYKTMPESNRAERVVKIQAADILKRTDEVRRIAELMLKDDPADVPAVQTLVKMNLDANQREQAVGIVRQALAAKPDNAQLKALNEAVSAQTPEEQQKLLQTRIDQITDPYVKALNQAQLEQSQGKVDQAIQSLAAAEKINPKDARAPEARYQLELQQKHWSEAETILDKLSSLNSDQTGGETRRIQLIISKAQAEPDATKREALFTDGLARGAALASKYKELAAVSLLYAQLLQNSGNLSDAVDQFSQTLEKTPTDVDALRGIITCLLGLGRDGEARARLDDGKRIAPDNPDLKQLEISYDLQFGDAKAAVDRLTATYTANPKEPRVYAQLAGALEQAAAGKSRHSDPASQKQATDFYKQALDVYENAYKAFPDDGQFAASLAEARRRAGDSAGAEQIFVSMAADPKYKDRIDVSQMLAEQYFRSGKFTDAERVLKGVISAVNPPPVLSVLRLAGLYAQQQRLNDALDTLALRRDDLNVQRQRIQLLITAGEFAQARQAVDEAIARNPTPDFYLSAVFLSLHDNQIAQAKGFLNKVLEQRPNEPAAFFYSAQIKLKSSPPDIDGARDDLIRTRDAAPTNVEARLALADVFYRKQDPGSALLELQKAWAANRTSKIVLLRLADAYARSSPPAWTTLQKLLDDAKQAPQFANDADVLFIEASAAAGRNNPADARRIAGQALAIAPTDPNVQQRYLELLLSAKAYRELLTDSEPMLSANKSAWWVNRARALANVQLQRKAEAVKEFDAAFATVLTTKDDRTIGQMARTIADQIDPKTAIAKVEPLASTSNNARMTLAELMQLDGNLTGAIEQVDRVLADEARLQPMELRRALSMGASLRLQLTPPDAKSARQAFEKLNKLAPNDPLNLNNMAYVLSLPESGGTPAEALTYSQKAYDLSINDAPTEQTLFVWDTHGWILVLNKRVDEGTDLLRRAAETATFPEVFLHLAQAYLAGNNLDGADSALSDAQKRIQDNERRKQPVDPNVRLLVARLSDDLAKRKAAVTTP